VKVVQALLDLGTTPNAEGGMCGNALLQKEADVNTWGGSLRSALQLALLRGHTKAVEVCLENRVGVRASDRNDQQCVGDSIC